MRVVYAVGGFTSKDDKEFVDEFVLEVGDFHVELLFRFGEEFFLAGALFAVADHAGEEFFVDDDTTYRGRNLEGGVFDVAGLVAEDGAEEFLFWSGVALALRSDFADEDVALFDLGADADDTVFVKVFGGVAADIGDVAGELLVTALGFAYFEGEFLDMDAGVDILADHAFADNDSVLEVVTLPRHEGNHHVASQSKFAALCGVAFAEHLTLLDLVAFADDRTEVDGGAVVGALVFGEAIFVEVVVEAYEAFLFGACVLDDDFG